MSTSKQPEANPSLRKSGATEVEPPSSRSRLRAALALPKPTARRPLGELLAQAGSVSETGIRRGLVLQGAEPDMRLGELLLKAGEIHADELYRALGEQLGVTYVRLAEFDVDPAALAAVPADLVRAQRVLPLMLNEGRLVLASADPTDGKTIAALRARTQRSIDLVLANPSELEEAIATHYSGRDPGAHALQAERILQQQNLSTGRQNTAATAQDAGAAQMVEKLLLDAVQRKASDIHVRSLERGAEARYRIDGSLVSVKEFDAAALPALVAHIRSLANIDPTEQRLPQDGAIRFNTPTGPVDVRVSVIPAASGVNVAMRIMDPKIGLRRVADIGLLENDQRRFALLLERSQGLILVAGPTGSGKTTTLYAALQELNTGEYNIVTVEDPVQYRLDGIVQVQAQPAVNFGYPQALRSAMRHDPDVILVGEIRDSETAKIAVESALTGHLVLSTLHTNSAAQAVRRLVELGIPPYLVNATLAGVLAQRLVRRNCDHCKVVENVKENVRAALGIGDGEIFWRGRGCKECSGTGYRGQVAVYELLEMSPQLRELVSARVSHEHLQARAVEQGMVRLPVQALALARAGTISLSEVFRARLE